MSFSLRLIYQLFDEIQTHYCLKRKLLERRFGNRVRQGTNKFSITTRLSATYPHPTILHRRLSFLYIPNRGH